MYIFNCIQTSKSTTENNNLNTLAIPRQCTDLHSWKTFIVWRGRHYRSPYMRGIKGIWAGDSRLSVSVSFMWSDRKWGRGWVEAWHSPTGNSWQDVVMQSGGVQDQQNKGQPQCKNRMSLLHPITCAVQSILYWRSSLDSSQNLTINSCLNTSLSVLRRTKHTLLLMTRILSFTI